jgi:hypothetical protein
LNVAIYRKGRLVDYYLLSYEKSGASYDRFHDEDKTVESFRFGESTIRLNRTEDTCQVEAELRLPVPGSNGGVLTGHFRGGGPVPVYAEPREVKPKIGQDEKHRWAMICPGMSLTANWQWPDGESLDMSGSAYLDRNDSLVGIDQLGIKDWFWGRTHIGEKTFVWYLLEADDSSDSVASYGFEIGSDGTVVAVDITAETTASEQATFGMQRATRTTLKSNGTLWLELAETSVIDDGPFYLRTQMRATAPDGQNGLAITESVKPSRVDLRRHRFLVQMRVLYQGRRSSMWLPLFCGPRDSRWRRLMTSWLPGSHRALLPSGDQSSDARLR